MLLSDVRHTVKQKIIESAQADARIVGCLDYGSTSEGRGDAWSDLDFALFIQDDDLPAFKENWKQWAARHDFNFVIVGKPAPKLPNKTTGIGPILWPIR